MGHVSSIWSVVCPGPSLDWSAIDPPDPVVCVNRGIQGATRCDYWACIDSPNPEHAVCVEDVRRLMPKVVTQQRRFEKWQRWQDLGLRCEVEPEHRKNWVQLERKGGPRYSMVSAMAFAVEQGATELRFYGVDMAGQGYHTGGAEREKAKNQEQVDRLKKRWAKRWAAERKELDQVRRIYQAAEKRGVRMVGLPAHVTGAPCPSQ